VVDNGAQNTQPGLLSRIVMDPFSCTCPRLTVCDVVQEILKDELL
jgi:hypothetical protein